MIQGTNLEGATLQIEAVTLTARCTGCGVTSRLEYGIFLCPSCGSTRLEILTGNELQVVEITVDDEESGEDTHGRHHD